MTLKYIFHNFTDKPFIGQWNGKSYTFKPGVKKYYPKGIAQVFAKHLANEVLTAAGKETYASPKKPNEVPVFMGVFNKAFLVEEVPDEDNLDIPDGGEVESDVPSMNVRVVQNTPIDPYDSHANQVLGPGGKPQVIGEVSEEEEYEAPSTEVLP